MLVLLQAVEAFRSVLFDQHTDSRCSAIEKVKRRSRLAQNGPAFDQLFLFHALDEFACSTCFSTV